MKILVACEFSGIVRDAFLQRGHHAVSCDLLPTDKPGPHYMGDVKELLGMTWDVMLAFPPCTHLAASGARHFARKQQDGTQQQAVEFFMLLAQADIPRICIENPVGIMSRLYCKPTQIIQPYMFGHPESKRTCLWLKGLSKLTPTNMLELPPSGRWNNQTPSGQNNLTPSANRWKLRSITYTGIAQAMAQQWG